MTAPVAYYELHTPDTAKAQAFYGGLFDWKFQGETGAPSPYFMIESGGDLQGGLTAEGSSTPMFLTYFHVRDLDRSVEKAKALGARVLKPRTNIPPGSYAVIADPQGAVLALWQEAAKQ